MNRLIFKMLLFLVILPAPVFAQTQGENWPRTFPLQQGSITIYAPQVDEFDGELIKFRAALAYREKADSDPVFGAGWFESPVKANRSGRAVRPTDIEVTELRFPGRHRRSSGGPGKSRGTGIIHRALRSVAVRNRCFAETVGSRIAGPGKSKH